MKRTYQPKKLHAKKEHGFRKEWRPPTAARFSPAAGQRAEPSFPPETALEQDELREYFSGRVSIRPYGVYLDDTGV